jgi:alpha-N-arabinofuranosidase
MKWTDPSILLVSCGQQGWNEWDRVVIDGLADIVDYHGLQLFTGSHDYYTNVFQPHHAERTLQICEALIERARYARRTERPLHIAFNEWNVWFRERRAGLEERYSLADALAVATFLNIFIRHCRSVRMANVTQLVNAIALIVTDPSGMFLQTIYHPFRLYAEHTHEVALDAQVDCETHAFGPGEEDLAVRPHRIASLGPFPLLDVSATSDAEVSELTLGVVNRARGRAISATIEVTGGSLGSPLMAAEVNGDDPDVLNSLEHPNAVRVVERRVEHGGSGPVTYEFPPHSVTVLRASLL